jgi:hypothetical protein
MVRAVTYTKSICRRLSLASWGELRWNPCHSLIFYYLSISIEGETADLVTWKTMGVKLLTHGKRP